MEDKKIRYCKKCVLSNNFFSVSINEYGLCNYCAEKEMEQAAEQRPEMEKFECNKNGKYDVVLAYSGGKDSTYTLYLLKEKYKMKVLAITYDNGFLAKETYQNIKNVCTSLDVDSLIVAPSRTRLNNIFKLADNDMKLPRKSLERASSICTYCIGLVKMCVYKEAIERKIPLIAFGWTPGQINIHKQVVTLNYKLIKMNFKRQCDNIVKQLGEDYQSFLLSDELLEENKETIPSLFYPFPNGNYREEEILDIIRGFGWVKPEGTDNNSTNCVLNAYAIYKHKQKYGFHPYAFELAGLVREGLMDRDEALRRIEAKDDKKLIEEIQNVLDGGRD